MRRWVIMATLLLLVMGGAALPEAWAGDAEDCDNADTLIKTEPARVVGACRRLAEQGDASALAHLGRLYYNGDGVPQSFVEAADWYRKAAEQGDAKAQFKLGACTPTAWACRRMTARR